MTQLFHGMRSKKSAEQIKKEGFCSYGSPVDEKKAIITALKHFGKEKILHQKSQKGELLRGMINEITEKNSKGRLYTWGTTVDNAPCAWWAIANPEHISLTLHYAGISEQDINKYLSEKYGTNCYRIKLDLKLNELEEKYLRHTHNNFNTKKRCILPHEIIEIIKCKSCNYTGQEIKDNV